MIRKKLVKEQRIKYKNIWPISESAGKVPPNWAGWLDNKKFALVLTHDVELQIGHDKCLELLYVEKALGYKSSFNLVPERYSVSNRLREQIVKEGFEIGVHGLYHDGKLFKDQKTFFNRVNKINHYLEQWGAVGFRAPAMHHNLNWILELNIKYDLSTFDVDPFEPQSDGVNTIFPFWIAGNSRRSGYVELPYTLVQDFTLFILMGERKIDVWKKKLDWIAAHGGMALLNVHPDYINFSKSKSKFQEFNISLYSDFLNYVQDKYGGSFWQPLPKDLAKYYKENMV